MKFKHLFASVVAFGLIGASLQANAAPGSKNYEGIDFKVEYEHFSPKALELLKKHDCIDCHRETNRKLGPSYHDVAERYRGKKIYMYHGYGARSDAVEMPMVDGLVKKVQLGGRGDWYKRTPMPINDENEIYGEDFKVIIKEILAIPAD